MKSTHKWTTEMKVNLLKIEERERNQGRGFMMRRKEAWDDIYENSTINAQTLRDNAARFRFRDIKPVRSQENVEENENEGEIIENINEKEEEENRIM